MPIRVKPYKHQREAFEFACKLFGLIEGGVENNNGPGVLQKRNPVEIKFEKDKIILGE